MYNRPVIDLANYAGFPAMLMPRILGKMARSHYYAGNGFTAYLNKAQAEARVAKFGGYVVEPGVQELCDSQRPEFRERMVIEPETLARLLAGTEAP